MFSNIKIKITELAYSAVTIAEDTLSTSTGQDKKKAAVEYVVSMLPIAGPFKPVLILLLSKFIDQAVESAVSYMKNIKNSEE